MAQPSTRQELIDYCKRKLGSPVLEINVADEQIEDLVDDAVQFFQERHFDGVYPTFYKYKVTKADIDRGRAKPNSDSSVGIVTTNATSNIVGTATTFSYYENSNYLQVPPNIIGVNKIFTFDGANTITHNMFSVKYQLFLNDIYYWGAVELLSYAMVKTYLEDLDFLLNTQKQIRFNKRQDRLYLDIDWSRDLKVDDYIVIECYRYISPDNITLSGTASISTTSNTVLGTNSSFTSEISINDEIIIANESRRVVAIDSDTSLNVSSSYAASSSGNQITITGFPDVWNDRFLKAYATAKIKYQWGSNLSKFAGIQMPGGVTLDGVRIMQEAKEELDKIEEEMHSLNVLPGEMFMG